MNVRDSDLIARAINTRNAGISRRAEAALYLVLCIVVFILAAAGLLHAVAHCSFEGVVCAGSVLGLKVRAPAYTAQHPDERLSQSLTAAFHAGIEHGESLHYRQGWRAGVWNGLFVGVLLGGALVAGAFKLGTWVGAL